MLKTLSFEAEHGHSQTLLPAIESVFLEAPFGVGGVDLFAVVRGPGSFTGLRVSLACVRGLAGEKPCFGALAPDVAAWAVRGRASRVLALTDLFHGEVFGGVYDGEGELVSGRESGELASVMTNLGASLAEDAIAVGSGTMRHRSDLTSLRPGLAFAELPDGLAPYLAAMAAAQASPDNTGPSADLMPYYLRDPLTRGLLDSRRASPQSP